jgi:cleavage and polyadenylation specificity factor subunit 1
LELFQSFDFFGNIQSIESITLSSLPCDHDALILSFPEGQVSVIAYDNEKCGLVTLSMHDFGRDTNSISHAQLATSQPFGLESVPTIKIDPDQRCAAMLVRGNDIMVMPFRCARKDRGVDTSRNSALPSAVIRRPYLVKLSELGLKGRVKDLVFLEGYFEPTLVVLQVSLSSFFEGHTHTRARTRTRTCTRTHAHIRTH